MQQASSMGACCEPDDSGGEFDATMASCCQRDLAQQAQAKLHLERLKAVDISTRRAELASAVLATPVYCHETQQSAESTETDAELRHLRQTRLEQLRDVDRQKSRLQSIGHGTLTELSQEHCLACEQLNEHLQTIAQQHMLIRVVFVRATDSYHMLPQFGAVPVPGLLCYERGRLTGAAALQSFGDSMCIQEEQVGRWIRRKLAASDKEQATSLQADYDDSQDEADDDKPCSLCGRRYAHEHIRSVQRAFPLSSESDSDD